MGIGPSTKETSLHHFRDPLLDVLATDPEIDFQGVNITGIFCMSIIEIPLSIPLGSIGNN